LFRFLWNIDKIFSFGFGMMTVEMPARIAAKLFSFRPPICKPDRAA
jgi:hypothetical protein